MSTFQPGAYDVERAVFSGTHSAHFSRSTNVSLLQQMEWRDRLVAALGLEPIKMVRRGGAASSASYATGKIRTITMGSLAGPAIVCHEVAHIIAGGEARTEDGYSHGPAWQAEYVRCVHILLGKGHASRLEKAFARFEAGKTKNLAAAAVKRGKQRTAQKSGPRVRTVVKSELTGFRSKALGKATITWAEPYLFLAIRYRTPKGWYWKVSGYPSDGLPERAMGEEWETFAHGRDTALFTETKFSAKVEALEWALAWAAQQSDNTTSQGALCPAPSPSA